MTLSEQSDSKVWRVSVTETRQVHVEIGAASKTEALRRVRNGQGLVQAAAPWHRTAPLIVKDSRS